MIETTCTCGQAVTAPESMVGQTHPCPGCSANLHITSGEQLGEGAGAGDFDGQLIVEKGPNRTGDVYLLGGVQAITMGKLSTATILLPGTMVSRHHATLNRVDFGPSRWSIEDNASTNGLWVNGERVSEGARELVEGDVITIGEFDFKYRVAQPVAEEVVLEEAAAVAAAPPATTRPGPAAPPMRGHKGLAYARPGAQRGMGAEGEALLGDADPNWVMTIRNSSHLLVTAITCGIAGRCMGGNDSMIGMLFLVGSALLSFMGAWMISKPEPGAPTVITGILLRVAAAIDVAGSILMLVASQMKSEDDLTHPILFTVGAVLYMASVPEFFLLLWTLRRMAIRLPSPGLALNSSIVMIGLPAVTLVTASAVAMAAYVRSPIVALLTGLGGLVALLIFRIWYIVLLIWFNKSFS